MADPKYADLPGIAYDQPDVYETSDLPEVDQNADYFEEEPDSIERLHISASEAFSKFKGKSILASHVDFSDRLSKSSRTGYDARSGEWEIIGVGEKETPLQKYQRLQCEIKDLLEEVSQLKGDVKDESSQEKSSAVVIAGQVEHLQQQLCDIRLEESLGSELITNLSDPQGALQKKLLSQLEIFKQTSVPKEKSKRKPSDQLGKEKGTVTYELYYKPEHARLSQTANITEIEQRIHKLEALLGPSSEKLVNLCLDTHHKSLMEAVQVLSAQTNLLDSAQLDHVEGRLTALAQKMNQIAEKNESVEDTEKDRKISELYELVKKSESMSTLLPEVVERMVALQSLHEQALQFSKTLTQLDGLQQQLSANLQNNEKMLKDVQENFSKNVDVIKKNISSLDTRLTALKK